MTSSTQSPRFSRRAKFIIGGAVAIITVLYIFACALLIDTFTQRRSPAVVGPIGLSPTPSVVASPAVTSTPAADQPQAAVSTNPIDPAAPLTVVGSNWVPNETVTILLRDPAQPSATAAAVGHGPGRCEWPGRRQRHLSRRTALGQIEPGRCHHSIADHQRLRRRLDHGASPGYARARGDVGAHARTAHHDADVRSHACAARDTVIDARVVDGDPDARAAHIDTYSDTHAPRPFPIGTANTLPIPC